MILPGDRRVDSVIVNIGQENLSLEYGRVYLICERRQERSLQIANELIYSGSDMLFISRMHPDLLTIQSETKRPEKVWLSERMGENNIPPEQLSRLSSRIVEFLEGKKGPVVLLDGIEYLCAYNDFSKVQKMMEQINDRIMASHAILLVPVDPLSFDVRSLARLRRFAEVLCQ